MPINTSVIQYTTNSSVFTWCSSFISSKIGLGSSYMSTSTSASAVCGCWGRGSGISSGKASALSEGLSVFLSLEWTLGAWPVDALDSTGPTDELLEVELVDRDLDRRLCEGLLE